MSRLPSCYDNFHDNVEACRIIMSPHMDIIMMNT